MRLLYPPLDPHSIQLLDVGAGHCLYVEECGRPDGVPVVFLHGGPGSGCRDDHARYFDPDFYRIVLFDQRGSGRSTPLGDTDHNNTRNLVADLERIRRSLGIDRWLLFGGSWGATLALTYAQTHGSAVSGMILRGTFLARKRDLDWFFSRDGAARLLPDAWDDFCRGVPPGQTGNPVAAYRRLVHGTDTDLALKAARAWDAWADRVAAAKKSAENSDPGQRWAGIRILARARIQTCFAQERYFLEENQLLEGTHRLPRVPIVIVHGRRDLVCPLDSAWDLHRAVPWSRLKVVAKAGHLTDTPAMIDALIEETDRMRDPLA